MKWQWELPSECIDKHGCCHDSLLRETCIDKASAKHMHSKDLTLSKNKSKHKSSPSLAIESPSIIHSNAPYLLALPVICYGLGHLATKITKMHRSSKRLSKSFGFHQFASSANPNFSIGKLYLSEYLSNLFRCQGAGKGKDSISSLMTFTALLRALDESWINTGGWAHPCDQPTVVHKTF